MAEIPFEREAIKNEPKLNDLSGAELLTHLAACWLYAEHRAGHINREDGTKLKRKIVQAYEDATKAQNLYSFIWSRLEASATKYAKEPTIENADKFYAAVYNMPDDWRLKR